MSKRIDELLLLARFFEEPRAWHLREIARATGMNPSTASKYLEGYVKEGLLTKRRERGNVLYEPDTQNHDFLFEKRIFNLRRIRKSGLLKTLDEQLAYPTVILFGSWAKGENHEQSDLDLFVIADEKRAPDLTRYEKKLGAEIELFLHTPEKFRELRKHNKELANNVMNGIILSGYVEAY